jgi:hypothetical protein
VQTSFASVPIAASLKLRETAFQRDWTVPTEKSRAFEKNRRACAMGSRAYISPVFGRKRLDEISVPVSYVPT